MKGTQGHLQVYGAGNTGCPKESLPSAMETRTQDVLLRHPQTREPSASPSSEPPSEDPETRSQKLHLDAEVFMTGTFL